MTAEADDPMRDWFMEGAWAAFMRYSFDQPEALEAFTAETGMTLVVPKSYLEALVDEATGYIDSTLFAFAVWATIAHWNVDMNDTPLLFRQAIADKGGPGAIIGELVVARYQKLAKEHPDEDF